MKHILSFILISALVFAASTNELEDVAAFVDGFAAKANVTDPHFLTCKQAGQNFTVAFKNAHDLIEKLEDGDAIELAVGEFGFQFAHTVRVCAKVGTEVSSMFAAIAKDIVSTNTSTLGNRLMMNMFALNMKFQAAKTALAAGDFKTLGQAVAEAYALILFDDGTARPVRKLSLATVAKSAPVNFNSTYLGFLGFLEEANTTVSVNDYVSFSNHTSQMIALAATLETAIQKMDFATILTALHQLQSSFTIISSDVMTLDAELGQFVQRDLPLFNSTEKIQKIGQYLMTNMPTTMMAFMRISNAYKAGDFREFGHGTGAFYNLLRTGAMSSF